MRYARMWMCVCDLMPCGTPVCGCVCVTLCHAVRPYVSFRVGDTASAVEHGVPPWLQVVLTSVQPRGNKAGHYDAYEYTAHSHTYTADALPSAKLTFDLSPIQILVTEGGKPWYHFLTTTCAIIGGVFTVAGILDAILYTSMKMAKKVQLGKHG